MTPIEEADLAQRRWIVSLLLGAAFSSVAAVLAFAFFDAWQAPAAGYTLLAIALAGAVIVPFVANLAANRRLDSTRVLAPVPVIARERAAEWNREDG